MENENKKILIVEDDQGFRTILEKNFEGTEFSTVAVEDAETALEKVKEDRPDLILLDIMLPGIDGVQMAKKLKESGVSIPIIYLTNVNDEKRISEAMMISGGETDYIVKAEVRMEEIIDRIRKRLGLK